MNMLNGALARTGNQTSAKAVYLSTFCLCFLLTSGAAKAETYYSSDPYAASDAQGNYLKPSLVYNRGNSAASDSVTSSQKGTQLVWADNSQPSAQPAPQRVVSVQEGDDDNKKGSHLTFLGQPASVSLGIGAFAMPAYEGAKKLEMTPVPFIDVRLFNDRAFLNVQDGLGVNAIKNNNWKAGFALTYSPGRSHSGSGLFGGSKDSRLTGVPDINGAALGKAFVSYTIRSFSVDADIKNRFGSDGGILADLGAKYHFSPLERLHMTVGPEITWANRYYNKTFFGVSEQTAQTATALGNDLTAYSPSAGIKDVAFSVTGVYALTDHWSAIGHAGFEELVGPAKNSPLTQRTFQPNVGLGVSYRF